VIRRLSIAIEVKAKVKVGLCSSILVSSTRFTPVSCVCVRKYGLTFKVLHSLSFPVYLLNEAHCHFTSCLIFNLNLLHLLLASLHA